MKRKDNIMVWRVFSFLCIFIIHLAHSLNAQGKIKVITDFGYTAVYFFIAISGYLAFAGYKDDTRAVDYWKRRAIRILPLYYSVILYFFITHTFIFRNVPPDRYGLGWFRYIVFLSNIVPAEHDFWRNIGMTWTINWLLVLYIITPFLHKIVRSFNKALVFCGVSYILFFFKDALFGEWMEAVKGLFYYSIGIAVFFAIREGKEKRLSALLVWGTFFFLIQSADHELTGITLFGILLMATDGMQLKDGVFKKAVCWIDRYCFEFYLIHGIVFNHIIWIFLENRRINSPIVITAVSVVCTVVLSVAVHELLRIIIYDRLDRKKAA